MRTFAQLRRGEERPVEDTMNIERSRTRSGAEANER
jgi:hypothetical protein